MSADRLVSVVIVNWNAGSSLASCLGSLFDCHPGLDLSVTVVDNASTDGSPEMMQTGFPRVRLLHNVSNRGFAAGCNRGLSEADPSSPFILVLNPDTRFESNVLVPLTEFLEANPDVAAVGPRVVGEDRTLQRGCRRREPSPVTMLSRSLGLDRLFPRSRLLAGYSYGDLPADRAHPVDSLSGSCMLIRREALERVGRFDERFFMYAEDLDWCRRARETGYRLYYHPAAELVHTRAVSSRKRPLARLWWINHTAVQYIRKHRRGARSAPLRSALYAAVFLRLVLGLPRALLDELLLHCRKTKV